MTRHLGSLWFLFAFFAAAGCITEASVGTHDGGLVATSARDAGLPVDASSTPDAGPTDGGMANSICDLISCADGERCCEDCEACIPTSVDCADVVCVRYDAGVAADAGEATCTPSCPTGQQCCPGCRGSMICVDGDIACPTLNCEHCARDCGPTAICCPTCNLQGECIALGETCREPMIRPCICEPQYAFGDGSSCPAPRVLGWRWAGDSCEVVEGCGCTGEHCDRLYDSAEQCELGCGYP